MNKFNKIVYYLHTETYKTLLKELSEDINENMDWVINNIKIAILQSTNSIHPLLKSQPPFL